MEEEIGCRVIIQEVLDIQFEYIHINKFISNTVNSCRCTFCQLYICIHKRRIYCYKSFKFCVNKLRILQYFGLYIYRRQ